MVFWLTLFLTLLGIVFMMAIVKISKKYRWGEDDNSKIIEYVHYHDDRLLFGGGAVSVIGGIAILSC